MPMMTKVATITCTALLGLGAVLAAQGQMSPKPAPPMERPQGTSANPLVDSEKSTYATYKGYFVAAAAEMPLDGYGFRPQTLPAADHKEVRTYSQLIGHIAHFCFDARFRLRPLRAVNVPVKQGGDYERAQCARPKPPPSTPNVPSN